MTMEREESLANAALDDKNKLKLFHNRRYLQLQKKNSKLSKKIQNTIRFILKIFAILHGFLF